MIWVVTGPSVWWEPCLAAAEARIEELAAGLAQARVGLAEAEAGNEKLAVVNGRLRQVVEDAAARHEAEIDAVRAERDQGRGRAAELERKVTELELEVAELRRRVGMDSTNSSVPPSKEPIGVREKRKAPRRQASERVRSKDRKPGGQPGHPGAGLRREAEPDRSLPADPPLECSSCEADLTGATVLPDTWAQVWDLLGPVLEKVEWVLPRRRCGCCRKVTTAGVPGVAHAAAGTVSYGPRLHAAAVLLASEADVPVERAAMVIGALLGVEVSAGFVARANARLAHDLEAAGFDGAIKAALRAEPVLCGDESPVNVLRRDLDEVTGTVLSGTPHLLVVRTPTPGLVWYAAIRSRSSEAIDATGVLDGFTGYLTRDDYAGWHQYDPTRAGGQRCCAHLIRSLRAVQQLAPGASMTATIPVWSSPAGSPRRPTRSGCSPPTSRSPGRTIPPSRPSASRNATRPSRATGTPPRTLAGYLRVRAYLVSARDHGLTAIDAIRHALAGKPWIPVPRAASALPALTI